MTRFTTCATTAPAGAKPPSRQAGLAHNLPDFGQVGRIWPPSKDIHHSRLIGDSKFFKVVNVSVNDGVSKLAL